MEVVGVVKVVEERENVHQGGCLPLDRTGEWHRDRQGWQDH